MIPDEGRGTKGSWDPHENVRLLVLNGSFSVFVNLLMLAGPLFTLQMHNRVLSSRSEALLVALIVIVAFW